MYPTKDLIQFKGKGYKWNIEQAKQHAVAMATGLNHLGFKSGDSFLSLLPVGPEQINLGIAAAFNGLNMIIVDGEKPSDSTALALKYKSKAIFCESPDIASLKKSIPDLSNEKKVSGVVSLDSLQYVIHSGQQIFPNTLRFRDILVYYNQYTELQSTVDVKQSLLTVVDSKGKEQKTYTLSKLLSESYNLANKKGILGDSVVEVKPTEVSIGILATLASFQTLGKVVLTSS